MREDDYELCGLEAVRKDWITDLLKGLEANSHIHVAKVIVFGSRAVNEHTVWSDYDVCIISPDFAGMKPWERMEEALKEWHGARPLEPVCYTPEEFETSSFSLVDEIKKKGRVVTTA